MQQNKQTNAIVSLQWKETIFSHNQTKQFVVMF